MSLWVDKHRPSSLNKLDYHKDQATLLKKLVSISDSKDKKWRVYSSITEFPQCVNAVTDVYAFCFTEFE
jgi:hypothetical protein